MASSYQYVFRNPFSSSIYPILSPDDTISILHQINQSKSSEKRLPTEILLRINEEVQINSTIWKEIRTTWSPVLGRYEIQPNLGYFRFGMTPLHVQAWLDLETKRYRRIRDKNLESNPLWLPQRLNSYDGTSIVELGCQISSADLLYRLRCYFPEATIDSNQDYYKSVWEIYFRHNKTGLLLRFYDFKAAASLNVHYDNKSKYQDSCDPNTKTELEDAFSVDGVRFLNALVETVDGSRRFLFYHPAADADIPTDNERYPAVPYDYGQERCFEEEEGPVEVHNNWHTTEVSPSDISSFRSILPYLKYDIPSRKVDPSNGTTNLTAVISSSLLFYRLICKLMLGHIHTNVNQVPPITSVWQIQLVHEETGASIIFMDDHGLFDIRADGKAEEVMSDIQALVELLCSDSCAHPYDVLAGCVA